jgi:glyoxylase-like metal-dependent hydrolase (beta-lactamase superfamily II)
VIIVESAAVGPFFKNGFVVACPRTHEGVLIDPGDEVETLLAWSRSRGISLNRILLTHAHVDHVTGVYRAKQVLGVPVHLHRADLFLYERAVQFGAIFGLVVDPPPPPIDAFYEPDDVYSFGDFDVRPHHTPGHCPGGVCLAVTQGAGRPGGAGGTDTSVHLFVGDTLFAGSIGRTDLPGGDQKTLIASIKTVLFGFGDAAVVYPGHGKTTTIGQERRTNPFLIS